MSVDESKPSMPSSPRTSVFRWRCIVFAAGLLTGLAVVAFRSLLPLDPMFDQYYFGAMGSSLARGEGFMPFGNLIQRRAPMYPFVIGGVYTIFGEHPGLIQILQCLYLGATCLLAFDIGYRLFNLRSGIFAGLACAVHPLLLRYVPDLHLESQLTFLFTLTIWFSVRFWQRPTIANGFGVGAAAALASLTKAVVILYPGVFAFGMVLRQIIALARTKDRSFPLVPLATIFLTMGLLIAPWTIRNYYATGGHFVLVSSGLSDAVLRSYIFTKSEYALLQKPPYTDAENESNLLLNSLCREAGTECTRNDWETDQILSRAARAKVTADPGAYVRKSLVGLFTFWYQLTSLRNSLVVGGCALVAWALALVGWRRAFTEGRPAWLVLAPVLYLNVLLALLLALGRYSVPILPSLLVLSAFGLDSLVPGRTKSSK